jgi:hypothetical protein
MRNVLSMRGSIAASLPLIFAKMFYMAWRKIVSVECGDNRMVTHSFVFRDGEKDREGLDSSHS